jgi:hypothetical protein
MAKKNTDAEDQEIFNDFNETFGKFLSKEAKIDMQSLENSVAVPFFIDSGSYATNWIIGNDMIHGGFPATKLTMVIGACLGPNELLTLQVSDEIAKKLQK